MKLSELLIENKRLLDFPCGGKGICGKCKLLLKDGNFAISEADRSFFTNDELEAGYRLACQIDVTEDFDISNLEIESESADIQVLTCRNEEVSFSPHINEKYDIAIDIGTTTLAFALVKDGHIIDTFGCKNPQSIFGADVISRIENALNGKAEKLRDLIIEGINCGIDYLINKNNLSVELLSRIVIAGNTVMLHLLYGYSVKGLSRYPFEPVSLLLEKRRASDLLKRPEFDEAMVISLPSISAFVGADIVAGLYYLDVSYTDKKLLFVDIGTNGEMALVSEEGISVTSTAAGPAFEGVNISCGKPAVKGAIYDVVIDEKKGVRYSTIANATPIGICGSGIVAAVSELLRNDIIDDNGTYIDKYVENGYSLIGNIRITAKDIREFQMAKAAIRTGIDILISEKGIMADDIEKVYLAGAFGNAIDVDNARYLGIFNPKIECEYEAVGNTSLLGCVKFLTDLKAEDECNNIVSKSREIVLANNKDFNDRYLCNINFEKDFV